jgi:nucleotide-binding universal stress UspA family protein
MTQPRRRRLPSGQCEKPSCERLTCCSSTGDLSGARRCSTRVPLLVVQSAPLADLVSGDQDARLNLAEILAGWKADYPDVDVETTLLAGAARDAVPLVSADVQLLVVGTPYRGREWTRWIRSVARAVLDRATCPVAVVPQQRRRSRTVD